jgi:energy-coupling factor transport system substrate-specific component
MSSWAAAGSRPRLAIVACAFAAFGAATWAALDPGRAGLSLLLAAAALIALGAAWLETGPHSAKELAIVATLAGVAAAGRVLFAAIPGVQPVTVIAMVTGVALGARAGATVGALAALASNLVLGQGIWTPWQMLGWGLCGVAGALARPVLGNRLVLAALACALGFAFSSLMDVWEWFSFFPHTWQALGLQMARGLPFDVAHAAGNLALAVVGGAELRRVLDRYSAHLRADIAWT